MRRPMWLRVVGVVAPALAIAWLTSAGALAADAQTGAAASKREFNFIPAAGGDSDIGIAVGQFSSLARLKPGPDLYNWRLESGTFISFKLRDEGIVIPVHDYYLQLTLRDLGPGSRIRLDVRGIVHGAQHAQVLRHRQRIARAAAHGFERGQGIRQQLSGGCGCARASGCGRTSSCTSAPCPGTTGWTSAPTAFWRWTRPADHPTSGASSAPSVRTPCSCSSSGCSTTAATTRSSPAAGPFTR